MNAVAVIRQQLANSCRQASGSRTLRRTEPSCPRQSNLAFCEKREQRPSYLFLNPIRLCEAGLVFERQDQQRGFAGQREGALKVGFI